MRGDITLSKMVCQSVVPIVIGENTIDNVMKVHNLTPLMKEMLINTVSINRWVSFRYHSK